ncbi:MAG: plasmid replication initiator TrfA [Pseudomonadota bacterium]|nr:plasmid replication initiator TrfA [Pseudomonadota bacterium]
MADTFDREGYARRLIEGGLSEADAYMLADKTAEARSRPAPARQPDLLERFKERAGEIKQPDLGRQLFLPGFEDELRALPNHLARSSLFAPIQRGRREYHKRVELASRGDVRILFDGEQLDEADRDVFMQALFEARKVPLGERVYIDRAAFLRAIGRHGRGQWYKWLDGACWRLFRGVLVVETKRYRIGKPNGKREEWMSLVIVEAVDEVEGSEGGYYIRIDPRILALFGNCEYSLVDWGKRLQIERRPAMAKWLQCLVATSDEPVQRYRLDDLKAWMAYTSPMRKFREALLEALRELERLEIIAAPRIKQGQRGQELAVWNRLNGSHFPVV